MNTDTEDFTTLVLSIPRKVEVHSLSMSHLLSVKSATCENDRLMVYKAKCTCKLNTADLLLLNDDNVEVRLLSSSLSLGCLNFALQAQFLDSVTDCLPSSILPLSHIKQINLLCLEAFSSYLAAFYLHISLVMYLPTFIHFLLDKSSANNR